MLVRSRLGGFLSPSTVVRLSGALAPREPLPAPIQIAGFFRVLERLARVAVIAPGPPVATASPRSTRASVTANICRSSRLRGEAGLLGRRPESPPREIFHFRIRVLRLDSAKCRQQLVTFGRSKCRWETAGDDGPIGVARGHQ